MNELPLEVIQYIITKLNVIHRIKFIQTCHLFYSSLKIIRFTNIPLRLRHKVHDAIVRAYPYIMKLDASGTNIFHLQHLKHLKILYAGGSSCITNESIMGLNLSILGARNNKNISDIKH